MLSVFVVSPLPSLRAGLRFLLEASGDCRVIGESDRLDFASFASGRRPQDGGLGDAGPADVIIVDAAPGLDVEELVASLPSEAGFGLVILGALPNDEHLPELLTGRAWGYLAREVDEQRLVAAVRAVGEGLVTLDGELAGRLLSRAGGPLALPVDVEQTDLTEREREVLALLALGLPNKLIARRLSISDHTVKFHVASILSKLGAGSRTEAVSIAAHRGLVAL